MSDAGTSWSPGHYPLVNTQKTVENHHAINGKSKRLPGRVLFHFLRSIAPKAPSSVSHSRLKNTHTPLPVTTIFQEHPRTSHESHESVAIDEVAWIDVDEARCSLDFSWHFPADVPLTIPAINDATETLHTWPNEAPTDDLQELDQNWSRTFAKRDASETLPVVTNYPWYKIWSLIYIYMYTLW